MGFHGKQTVISGSHISHKALVQQVSREERAGPFVQLAGTQSSLLCLYIFYSDAMWYRLHANLQNKFFSSPSVANVHICFKVGRICPWVVFDLEEINPRMVTHKKQRWLDSFSAGEGYVYAEFTYPEEEVEDKE